MQTKRSKNLTENEKMTITGSLRNTLEKHAEISFAYLHGSFVEEDGFRDIDVAVYLKEIPTSPLEYELNIEAELMGVVSRYSVDARVLNNSPLFFRYNVIKNGIILFAANDDERADFQETTLSAYFDFAHHRNIYLKETLGFGAQSG